MKNVSRIHTTQINLIQHKHTNNVNPKGIGHEMTANLLQTHYNMPSILTQQNIQLSFIDTFLKKFNQFKIINFEIVVLIGGLNNFIIAYMHVLSLI